MNPGLLYLLGLHMRSEVRRVANRFHGTRGKVLLGAVVLLVGGILYSQYFAALGNAALPGGMNRTDPDSLRQYGAPALLLVALLGTRAHGFYFKPAEVGLLFPAPVSRRELLLFNMLSRMQTSVLSAAFAALFVSPYAGLAIGAFLGIFLVLTFMQLTGQLFGLALAMLAARGWSARVAWVVYAGALLTLAAALVYASSVFSEGLGAAVSAAMRSPLVVGLCWITRPFIEVFLAPGLSGVINWTLVAAGILLAQVLVMLQLDGAYLQALVVRPSRRRDHWWQRLLSGFAPSSTRPHIPITLLPYWGGAGPIAWRQFQELARSPSTLLRGGYGMLVVMPILVFRLTNSGVEGTSLSISLLLSSLFAIPILIDGVDFRRDLDRIAVLRSLPLSPVAISLGQIIPTAGLIIFWTAVATTLIALFTVGLQRPLLIIVCCLIPAYALLTAAIDNFLFLLMPYRLRTRDPGETTFLGRLVMMMSVKIVALVISLSACAVVTAVCIKWLSLNAFQTGVVASLTLTACAVPMIYAVAWAFRRFDVSREVPG
jgi:hypothetical protein